MITNETQNVKVFSYEKNGTTLRLTATQNEKYKDTLQTLRGLLAEAEKEIAEELKK